MRTCSGGAGRVAGRCASGACRVLAAIGLLVFATALHAQTAYQCVDARGVIAFQAVPCGPHARQTQIALRPLPRVQSVAPPPAAVRAHAVSAGRRAPHARTRPAMSWECRARDG